FDIKRAPGAHVAFGDGIHYCLGAALARLEANAAFDMMIDRFPRIALAEPAATLTYKGSYALRGLASLKITIS
ncbi:MAG: cytochrome P450, partial [Candidatus Binataceae bacterium]